MTSINYTVAEVDVSGYDSDDVLLKRVLRPYWTHCHYLKAADVTSRNDPSEGGHLTAVCEFEIPESCYIDDTGHFNSVEFNICYNQMLYYLLARSVQDKLAQPFAGWTMDEYWTRQLTNILIIDFHSTFKRGMRGRHFFGEIDIVDIAEWDGSDIREPLIVVHTVCRYWDDHGGASRGEVRIAITHPPRLDR